MLDKKAIAAAVGVEEYYLFEPTWKLRTTNQLLHVIAELRKIYQDKALVDEIVRGMAFIVCHDAQDGEGEDSQPLERAGLQYDIDETSELEMKIAVYRFLVMADPMDLDCVLTHYEPDQVGMDIWHGLVASGVGFWSRDLPDDVGDRLSSCAKLCSHLSYAWLNQAGKISVE